MTVEIARSCPVACLTILLFGPGAAAQSVDEIVAKHLAARGGIERIKAIRTMKITRTVPTLGSTMKLTIYKKRPGLYRSEQRVGERPPVVRGLNPSGLWEVAGGKLTMRPQPMAVELGEFDADIDGMLVDWRAKGHDVQLEGRGIEGGVDTHKLKVTLKSGAVRYVFLDAKTFLERKQVGQVTLPPDRKVATQILFSDYREVGGLTLPFAIDEERDAMGQTFAFYTDTIELDVPMEDALFQPPPDAVPADPPTKPVDR